MKEGSRIKTRPDIPHKGEATAGNNGSGQGDFRAGDETSEQESANTEPWTTPENAETALRPVPPMTREMLPDLMAVWLCDVAHRMQCPLDFVVAATFVMTSSILGTQVRMRLKQYDSWEVAPHLWGGVVGPPGSKKTPSTSAIFKLLDRLEIKAAEVYKQEEEAYKLKLSETQPNSRPSQRLSISSAGTGSQVKQKKAATDRRKNSGPTKTSC